MTERAQNADFHRKPQIFADSPLHLEIPAFGGRRKPQKTADFRRKPKIFAENRRKPQIGLRHLRSITLSSALQVDLPKYHSWKVFGAKITPKNHMGMNIDERQITHLICARLIYIYMTFLGAVLGLFPFFFLYKMPNNTP